jgi:hypothetical protein
MSVRHDIDRIFESGIDHDLILGWPDLVEKAEKLFQGSASAWERANNNAHDAAYYKRSMVRHDKLRADAEALLAPLGIEVDYPGLYPSFKVGGYDYYATKSAVRAALNLKGGKYPYKKTVPIEQKPLKNMIQSRKDHPLPSADESQDDYGRTGGERRKLPYGSSGANMILTKKSYDQVVRERREEGKGNMPPPWSSLKVYEES